jgi:hypothetical protein
MNHVWRKSTGFWRWCVIICNSVFFYFVHRLYFIKFLRFGSWIFFRLQVKKKGERSETLAVGPPGWASLRPRPQSWGFCSSSFFTWRQKKIQLPKRSNFIKYRRRTMSKKHLQIITYEGSLCYLTLASYLESFLIPALTVYLITVFVSLWENYMLWWFAVSVMQFPHCCIVLMSGVRYDPKYSSNVM